MQLMCVLLQRTATPQRLGIKTLAAKHRDTSKKTSF